MQQILVPYVHVLDENCLVDCHEKYDNKHREFKWWMKLILINKNVVVGTYSELMYEVHAQ